MTAVFKMLNTMEILCSNDVWVYDTAVSSHFSESKDGAYNCHQTDVLSHRMTGGHVEVCLLTDFTMTHYINEGV